MADAKHTPTPYSISDKPLTGRPHDIIIVGDRHYSHDDGCQCECDGDGDCTCLRGCGFVATTVAAVLGNETSGGIPRKCAEFVVTACNSHDALLAACTAGAAHLMEMLGKDMHCYKGAKEAYTAMTAAIAKATGTP